MNEERLPVDPTEWLFRRSRTPEKKYMNPDGTATSRVFKLREKDNGELSVNVKSMTTPEKAFDDAINFLLFEIANIDVINIGLFTYHDPCTIEVHGNENSAHAVIVGMEFEDDDVKPGLLARKARRVFF